MEQQHVSLQQTLASPAAVHGEEAFFVVSSESIPAAAIPTRQASSTAGHVGEAVFSEPLAAFRGLFCVPNPYTYRLSPLSHYTLALQSLAVSVPYEGNVDQTTASTPQVFTERCTSRPERVLGRPVWDHPADYVGTACDHTSTAVAPSGARLICVSQKKREVFLFVAITDKRGCSELHNRTGHNETAPDSDGISREVGLATVKSWGRYGVQDYCSLTNRLWRGGSS